MHFYRQKNVISISTMINPLECFFGSESHVALDRNLGPGYKTLPLQLVAGDLFIACPHWQFHTLPSFSESGYTVKLLP